jgi:diguanylate cyclase (GGDEF)-like protein/PAS domain S-box-containing protein
MTSQTERALTPDGYPAAKPRTENPETENDDLRTLLALHAIALGAMSHGVCVLDAEGRLALFNRRLLDIFELPSELMCLGMSFRALLELGIMRGHYTREAFGETWHECKRKLQQRKPFVLGHKFATGNLIKSHFRPVAAGGWVVIHDLIIEQGLPEPGLERQIDCLQQVFNHMSQGLCLFDANERLLVCNEQYLSIYGFDRTIVKPGISYREILDYAVNSGKHKNLKSEELHDRCMVLARTHSPTSHRLNLSNGKVVETTFRRIADGGWVAVHEDVTVRIREQEVLRERNLLLDATLENMAHGLCAYDCDLRLIFANRSYLEIYGLSADEARPGVTLLDLMRASIDRGVHVPGVTADQMFADYKRRLIERKESALYRKLADGRVIAVRHRQMINGGWVGTYEDITERQRFEAHIARLARLDTLTELPNRVMFREQMDESLSQIDARRPFAIFCVDLDNFKTVNDTLGHQVGDKLLQVVGTRLRYAINDGDTIARLGGDEFAILHRVSGSDNAARLAGKLIESMSEPVFIEGHEINIGLSAGIVLAPEDGRECDQLMRYADLALYRAKAEGRNTYRFYKAEMSLKMQSRHLLELDLRRALQAGEFSLVYQPQVTLATSELAGFEVLMRWTHPKRGLVSPEEFIPIAEDTGLITSFGAWVLHQACAEATRWPDEIRVAVNLSPTQLRGRGFMAAVKRTLAETGLPARRLELEITERVLMQKDEAVLAMLHQLRSCGIRIALDDFGTGYSSLNYLRSFPFDRIKIDRSFTADMHCERGGGAIIQAIATLGASLGIETTAEGVETSEQLDAMRRAGCTEVQGFLLSRPRPASELPAVFFQFRQEYRPSGSVR